MSMLPSLDGAIGTGRMEGPDASEAQWYFSREEIENSPSRKDGIDVKKETFLRRSYCTYCQALGMRLKVPQLVIATAIVFCHRFFLRQSHAKNDRQMIATICMFIACKVEENPRQLKELVHVAYLLRYEKDPQQAAKIKQKELQEDQREMVLVGERLVLATLGFDLNVGHAYKPLINFAKKMSIHQQMVQVAWNFINDGLRTSLSLQYRPQLIAAGALYLAGKFVKKNLPSEEGKEWYEIYAEGLPPGCLPEGSNAAADILKVVMDVSNQLLELYEHSKGGPGASRSSDPSRERGSKREQRRTMSLSLVGPARSGSTLGPARTQMEREGVDGPCSARHIPSGLNGQRQDAAEGDSGSVRPAEGGAERAGVEGPEGREAGSSRPSTSAEGRPRDGDGDAAARDEDRGDDNRQGNGHVGGGADGAEAGVTVKEEEAMRTPKVEADLDDDAIEAMLEAPLEPTSARKPKGNKEAILSLLAKTKPVLPLDFNGVANGDRVVKMEATDEEPDTKRRRLGAENDSRASPYKRGTPEHVRNSPRPPL